MNQILLIVDSASLARSRLGTVFGTVFLQVDGNTAFPEQGWSDMVIPVAAAWLAALARLANGSRQNEEVRFMDGPFKVCIRSQDQSIALFTFVEERSSGDTVTLRGSSELQDLFHQAIAVGSAILNECQLRGWNDGDTMELSESLKLSKRIREEKA